MECLTVILFYIVAIIFLLTPSSAIDTILPNQTLKDGVSIVSAAGIFELGFFSLTNSNFRYLGIWYAGQTPRTVVWVANRQIPITDPSAVLKVNSHGTLELLSVNNTTIWSSQSELAGRISPVAQLLDSGNLVVKDGIGGNLIWQSFDHPGDTLLPGMKLGVDLVTGIERNLTSWKSYDDPSTGLYTVRMDITGYPQLYSMQVGSSFVSRLGFWNGLRLSGARDLRPNSFSTFEFVLNHKEIYYSYLLLNSSILTMMKSDPIGTLIQLIWVRQEWVLYSTASQDLCDQYNLCGPYGSCNIDSSPLCGCLEGFEPKLPDDEWSKGDYTSGCKQKKPLTQENGQNFKEFKHLKLPDSRGSRFNSSMVLGECEKVCLNNISCTAFANMYITSGGRGCLLWFDELVDIRELQVEDGSDQSIYIKMSELSDNLDKKKGDRKKGVTKVILPTISAVVLVGLVVTLFSWRKWKTLHLKSEAFINEERKQDMELQLISFNKIVKATSNFSINNKLGEGGFGAVYKGVLEDGNEIAVKRLSKTSRQGLVEFQNEVVCIAKLQHRNLMKLLGYCIQGEEMMLIYEYMANKSLDSLLFDENNSSSLDWSQRYDIINGIARGLLYLHQDSRLRIIHRDLKASNILLDAHMNPKISDFGLARMFREYETEANTNKVVGTLGYISPEYAANGLFPVKSDIFSFGVLVLEIVSGKKNRGFSHQGHHDNLLGHAWRLYKGSKPLELVDVSLGDSWTVSEVLQSIHVGLLCVQQHAEDRPSMLSVVHMLGGEDALPPPKQPGFFIDVVQPEVNSTNIKPPVPVSINKVTITQLEAR